ncbi:MAG: hypothetical protein AAFR51_03915 [Pseudomonadota bacterium]
MVQTRRGAYVYPNPDGKGRVTFLALDEPSDLVLKEIDKLFALAQKYRAWLVAYISDNAKVNILDFAFTDEKLLEEAYKFARKAYSQVSRDSFRTKRPNEPYSCFDLDDLNNETDHVIANVIFNTMCLSDRDERYNSNTIVERVIEKHDEMYKPIGKPFEPSEFPYGSLKEHSEVVYHLCFHGTPVDGEIHEDHRLWFLQSAMVRRWMYSTLLYDYLTKPNGSQYIVTASYLKGDEIPGGLIVAHDFFRHGSPSALEQEKKHRISLAEQIHGPALTSQQLSNITTSVEFEGDVVQNMAWELIRLVITKTANDMNDMHLMSEMMYKMQSRNESPISFPPTRYLFLRGLREQYRQGHKSVDPSWVQYDYLVDPDIVTRVMI